MGRVVSDEARREYIADRLMSDDEELAWKRDRAELLGLPDERPTPEQMRDAIAADRAAVEALYDPRDFGWWQRETDD